MSTTTNKLKLFKYDTVVDKNSTFNIDNALNYNWDNLENGITILKYNPNSTYSLNDIVSSVINNKLKLYRSKTNNNTGNALTNTTYWEEIELNAVTDKNNNSLLYNWVGTKQEWLGISSTAPLYAYTDSEISSVYYMERNDIVYTMDSLDLTYIYDSNHNKIGEITLNTSNHNFILQFYNASTVGKGSYSTNTVVRRNALDTTYQAYNNTISNQNPTWICYITDTGEIIKNQTKFADTDYFNKRLDGNWIEKVTMLNDTNAVGEVSINLASYLPDNNFDYEVIIHAQGYDTGTNNPRMYVYTNELYKAGNQELESMLHIICNGNSRHGLIIAPIIIHKNNQNIIKKVTGVKFSNGCSIRAMAYRRLGSNE